MVVYRQIFFFFSQMTLTPEEYKGHTSDPCSPNMCGFLTPGKPGSEPPGLEPTQTTVSLNTAPANATFWHFAATGESPLALEPRQWLRFIHSLSCNFLHLISSLPKQVSTSPAQRNQREKLVWSHLVLPGHLPKRVSLQSCWMPTEFLEINTPQCFADLFSQF